MAKRKHTIISKEGNKAASDEKDISTITESSFYENIEQQSNKSSNSSINSNDENVDSKKRRRGKCTTENNKIKKEEIVEAAVLRLNNIFDSSWQQIINDPKSKKMPHILKEAKFTLAKIHYERNGTTLLKSIAPTVNLFEKKFLRSEKDREDDNNNNKNNNKSNFLLSVAASVRSLHQNEKRRINKLQSIHGTTVENTKKFKKLVNLNVDEMKSFIFNNENEGIKKLISMVEKRHNYINEFSYESLFQQFPKLSKRTSDLFEADGLYFATKGINFEALYKYNERIWEKIPQNIFNNFFSEFSIENCENNLIKIKYKNIYHEPSDKATILKQIVLLALTTKSYLVPVKEKYFVDVLIKLVNGRADYTCKSKNTSRYFGSKCLILEKEITRESSEG
uniref:DUF4806 domain-containing protein n=1 Tax=Strongyloides papillosus TaxID=174720 RepID=A0A0N5BU20_STREA